jgi:hypothetical protein
MEDEMTLEDPKNVLEFIEEEPECWIYKYICALNGRVMYSVFTDARYIDIWSSPYAKEPILIYGEIEIGAFGFTLEGLKFLEVNNFLKPNDLPF